MIAKWRADYLFFDLLLGVLASAGVIFILRILTGFLLLPIRSDRCKVRLTVSVKGHVPGIEYVLRGARWLARAGSAELTLFDEGMDAWTARCAEKLAGDLHFSILEGEVTGHDEPGTARSGAAEG